MRRRLRRLGRLRTLLVEELALFSVEYLFVIAVGVACIFLFYTFASALLENSLTLFDNRFTSFVQSYDSPQMASFMKGITFMGNFEFMVFPFFIVFIYFLFIKPHRWFSIKVPVVAIGSITTNLILKRIFDRPRPEIEHLVEASGFSFPSGHAMFSFSFIGLLIYISWFFIKNKFIRNSVAILLFTLAILIGLSRIYVGVHYPSDVIAGFSAGLFWLLLSLLVITMIEKKLARTQGNFDPAM